MLCVGLCGCRSLSVQPMPAVIYPVAEIVSPPLYYEAPQYCVCKPACDPCQVMDGDPCPTDGKVVYEAGPTGYTGHVVPEQKTSQTVFQNDRGHPYKGDTLNVGGIAAEQLKPEQLLITLTESVTKQTGVTLDRQCIEKGSVVIYCTTATGYIMEVESNQTGDMLNLIVWVKPRRAEFNLSELEDAGRVLFDAIRPQLVGRLGVVE
jgi:hypothetical protein